jgi:hypothetical protein
MWNALVITKLNTYGMKTEQCKAVNTKLQLPILCLSILWKYQQPESKKTFDLRLSKSNSYYNDSELKGLPIHM